MARKYDHEYKVQAVKLAKAEHCNGTPWPQRHKTALENYIFNTEKMQNDAVEFFGKATM